MNCLLSSFFYSTTSEPQHLTRCKIQSPCVPLDTSPLPLRGHLSLQGSFPSTLQACWLVFKSAPHLLVCPGPLHWLSLHQEGFALNTLTSCPTPTSSLLPRAACQRGPLTSLHCGPQLHLLTLPHITPPPAALHHHHLTSFSQSLAHAPASRQQPSAGFWAAVRDGSDAGSGADDRMHGPDRSLAR